MAERSFLVDPDGGVLTMSEAADRGYAVADECALCGTKGDTVHHRTYCCEATRDKVKAVVPPWFWNESQRSSPSDRFWTTGVIPHPADVCPPPRDDYLPWAYDGEGERCEDAGLSGNVFIDGSCSVSAFKELQRAAFALVQVDDAANPIRTISIPLWSTLPQTSQASEYAAFAAAPQLAEARARVFGDCQGVLDLAARGPAQRYFVKKKYAGVLLSMNRHPEGMRRTAEVFKVKAHQHPETIEDPVEKWEAIANNLADEAAKEARKRHPAMPRELEAQLTYWGRRIPLIVRAVGTAMAEFPPAGGKLERVKRAPKPKDGEAHGTTEGPPTHRWAFVEGRWRCETCWTYVLGGGPVPARRRLEPCRGGRFTQTQKRFEDLGHSMVRTRGELPISMCVKCGCWSSRRANRLSKRCGPPTASGQAALRRLELGQHPWRARDATTGKERPRGRLLLAEASASRDRRARASASNGEDHAAQPMPIDNAFICHSDAEPHPKKARSADLTSDDSMARAARCTEELMEWRDDEEDVFGHGGGFDQPQTKDAPPLPAVVMPVGEAAPVTILVDDCGRDTRLRGTTMHMLVKCSREMPNRAADDYNILIYNAATQSIIKTRAIFVEREIAYLRSRGIHDEEPRGELDIDDLGTDGSMRPPKLRRATAATAGERGRKQPREKASAEPPTWESGAVFVSREALLASLRTADRVGGEMSEADREPALRRPAARHQRHLLPPALPPPRPPHTSRPTWGKQGTPRTA